MQFKVKIHSSLVPSRSAGATKNEPIDKTSLGMTSVSSPLPPQVPLRTPMREREPRARLDT